MENYGSFLFQFEINTRKTIRLIESTDKKLTNAELALLFNETCKNENILPRYTDLGSRTRFSRVCYGIMRASLEVNGHFYTNEYT